MYYVLSHVILGFGILAFLYLLLTLEIVHRTIAATFVAGLMILLDMALRFVPFRDMINEVDMNTILLLMCMMMFVSILKKTGIFDHMASRLLKKFYFRPFTLVVILSGFTALVSAFIDNVTTVLLISPVILDITQALDVDPRPILTSVVFASNIGGTATLIGDPPNILIGTRANLGFKAFIYNLTPAAILSFLVFVGVMFLLLRNWLKGYSPKVHEGVHPPYDRRLLRKSLIALFVTLALFGLEDVFKYPPAIPPIVGIGILLMSSYRQVRLQDVISGVDWSTLVFFMMMFIIIKGVESLGVMDFIAEKILWLSSGFLSMIVIIVWISAFMSAFVDNIPFVMSMIPVIGKLSSAVTLDPTPLYWALSIGGCLGGNGTLVGASANVVVAGISERQGYPISFRKFMEYGMPVMISTVLISTIYLVLRYCVLGI